MNAFLSTRKKPDRILFITVLALVGVGFFFFISAVLGHMARAEGSVVSIVLKQVLMGILGGGLTLFVASKINYRVWKKWAPYLYALAILVSALVFIPALGISSGGATRWLSVGPISFQPAEALKIGTIFMLAAMLVRYRSYISKPFYGIAILITVLALPAAILLLQPDTGTFGVIAISCTAMFLASGARWRDVFVLVVSGILLISVLAMMRPYVLDRIMTFINPFDNPLTSDYQLQQSLIAVGSGGITGRGFGQSVQKFSYLPEPMSDSIFAVISEETGFIGTLVVISLFILFAVRGLRASARAPDKFGALVAVGITTYIVGQAFINIAAIIGLIPLTGIPLVFMSQGGTAMLIALGATGILLNISSYSKK